MSAYFKTKLCRSGHSAQQEWLFHYLRFRDCFAISWLYSYSTTLRSKGLVTSCACWNFFFGQNSRQLAPGKNYRPMWSETRRRQHPLTSKKFFLNSKKQEYSWFILNKLEFFGFPIIFISVWKSDRKKGLFLSSSINLFSAYFGLGPEFEKDIFQIWSAILLWKLHIKF